jgi:ABC-type molybdate transport system substrate-binding protein
MYCKERFGFVDYVASPEREKILEKYGMAGVK